MMNVGRDLGDICKLTCWTMLMLAVLWPLKLVSVSRGVVTDTSASAGHTGIATPRKSATKAHNGTQSQAWFCACAELQRLTFVLP
jgi:hypothetical protein